MSAITPSYDLDTDTLLGGNSASDYVKPSQKAIKTYVDNHSGGGTATDVQINGTSITSSNVANIITNSAYNSSSNKIATMSDVPTVNNATLTIQKNGTTVKTFTANASSNVTANITVPTQANDISAADTDLSNLSATGKKVIDGTWVFSYSLALDGQSLTGSTDLSLDISSYLPNDSNDYEVLIGAWCQTGTAANNFINVRIGTYGMTENIRVCQDRCQTANRTGNAASGVILPIGASHRTLYVSRAASGWVGTASVALYGYRRIGTNS